MENKSFVPGDPILIENIVTYLKAKGIFDEFRHDCLADVDTKSSCQNLTQRVDGYTTKFLSNETWNPDMNKNELRNKLRRQIDESGMLAVGADHVVEQVINPKIGQLFLPRIIEVVHQYLMEENEKLSKKQKLANENSSAEKLLENTDGNSNKTKTPVLDPIADILSFTYSKPKPVAQNNAQKSETIYKKGTDVSLKAEKKKEDINLPMKNADSVPKIEKKEEENTLPIQNVESIVKSDQKESIQTKSLDTQIKSEKLNEDTFVKLESNESPNDNTTVLLKLHNESKEVKLKKEIKTEEMESQLETQKKIQKDDFKQDKKKSEDLKLSDGSILSEENKPVSTTPKPSSHSKSKHDPDKLKKAKTHALQKTSSNSDKIKSKESIEKHSKSSSSKPFKSSSKEHSSSIKNDASKPLKKEKPEDDSVKVKSVDSHSNKSSDSSMKKSSSKSNSIKKEGSSNKHKYSSNKHEREKSSKKHSIKSENHPQSSTANVDKLSKNSVHYSSSYESSQGSDQDRSYLATEDDESQKQKHYSKHQKKENSSEKGIRHQKDTPDLKRSHKTSDQDTFKKHKSKKTSKITFQEKLKESTLSRNLAKVSSRSNSFGSASSTSDSSNVSKEPVASSSEDVSENSAKQPERKRKPSEREPCSSPQDFSFPPPPPPPTSDLLVTETSSSPEETMQSSQESEAESSEESDSDSDADSCSSALDTCSQNSGVESDLFLYESSSSEFEGFSSPEREKGRSSISDSVSSVHTSDLSSYEDDISVDELSSEDIPPSTDKKIKKKLSLKEAQDLLQRKEAQRNSDVKKETSHEGPLMKNEPVPEITVPAPMHISSPEEETSPRPEPRRELRRERKLNPKYASNEYTSIFNSKRTSFITKQMNLSPQKPIVNTFSTEKLSNANPLLETPSKASLPSDISVQNVDKMEITQEKYPENSNMLKDECSESISTESKNIGKEYTDCKEHEAVLESKRDLSSNINSNNLTENKTSLRLTLNIKNSTIVTKDSNPNGLKRKFDVTDKVSNKRLCRNSVDSGSSRNVANENKPFNNETINKSILASSESKNNLHKPKANGDVLGKIEHLRKSSHSKSSRASDES